MQPGMRNPLCGRCFLDSVIVCFLLNRGLLDNVGIVALRTDRSLVHLARTTKVPHTTEQHNGASDRRGLEE